MPLASSTTISINGRPVQFAIHGQRLVAYDKISLMALTIDGPQEVSHPDRCFESLKNSHLILRNQRLAILPRGYGGAGGKQEAAKIPEEYICSITHQLMYDPVLAADGETYEREAIERHLQSNGNSPMHGDPLQHKLLTPNRALKRAIETFRQKTQSANAELYLPTSLVQACQTAVLSGNLGEIKIALQKEPRLFQHTFEGNQSLLELSFQTTPANVKALLEMYPEAEKPELTHKLCAKISKAQGSQGLQTLVETYKDNTSMNVRLESAIAYKAIDYAKAALHLGADPNQANACGLTPLHQSIDSDSKALISILLQSGAHPKQPATNGQTPAQYAIQKNKPHLANHIAFQKQKLRVRPHLPPLQKQVDMLFSMQLTTSQSPERISNKVGNCQPVKDEINQLFFNPSEIIGSPTTSTKPSRNTPIQCVDPREIQKSDLIELLNQHFQDMDTLLRLYSKGELKLTVQEHKLILHYASAGLLMRIFHLLGIAANQKQLPQLFRDELRPFERPTAYEYRGQLMHHLFKFRGCTQALLNTAQMLAPLSQAIQSLKHSGQAAIAPQELCELPIHKIAHVNEGIETAVGDQQRAIEDIDQYFVELSVLHQQAEALKNKNPILWEHAGLLHFAITTLSCAVGQRLKDIANYPAYQSIKNKLTAIDPSAITTTKIGRQTHTATLFEIDRLRFGHAYNAENLAPGKADVNKLREKAFVLVSPHELEKRLFLGSKLAPTRKGRQEPIPLFFQESGRNFSFSKDQTDAFNQALSSLSGASSSSVAEAPASVPVTPSSAPPVLLMKTRKRRLRASRINSVAEAPASAPVIPSSAPPVPSMAFGKADWAKYFGDIGKEPPLPPDIEQILNSSCPIWPGKKVHDTHMLTLIPSHINEKPLTLEYLGEVVKSPKTGHTSKWDFEGWHPEEHEKAQAPKNYWALMTKDVIPYSLLCRSYSEQCQLSCRYSGYEAPRIHEAAISIFMEHARSGQRLYGNNPYTFTRCQEKFKTSEWHMIVGGFGYTGLRVGRSYYTNSSCHRHGFGGVRKFL